MAWLELEGWGWLEKLIMRAEVSQAHLCVKIHPALGENSFREVRVVTWTPMKDLKQEPWAVHIGEARTERGLFMA